jgi:acetyltransferase-like isoleucine patch superfamily enzyme
MKQHFLNAARLLRDIRHLPNTLYFNFHYFPFRTAIRLPVLVSANVRLIRMQGRVNLNAPVAHRMIRIGFGNVGIFDRQGSKSIWEVSGTVQFNGRADIGHGSKICASGTLILGDNFTVTAESQIVCFKKITFGRDCLMSWQVLVMDTDFHAIHTADGQHLNPNRSIHIGDKNWIGCRTLILKGAATPNNCVIAAGSTVSRSMNTSDSILAGTPATVVRTDISWQK